MSKRLILIIDLDTIMPGSRMSSSTRDNLAKQV